jgi:general secretion pathway protein D
MVYSPERNSLAGTAPTGNIFTEIALDTDVYSGRRHTLQGVKDANGSNMGRGRESINRSLARTSALVLRALLLLCCLTGLGSITAHAQSAAKWDKRGAAAEARQDYDAALEAYHQALLKKPTEILYKSHYERMVFLAAVSHIDRGRVLRQSGDFNGAFTEFTRAAEIDPGNQTAQQELDLLRKQQPSLFAPLAPVVPNEQMSRQSEALKEIDSMAGPIQLKPVSDEPITLHMVEDVKVIYQAIGKAAGLNVLFDPEYTSKRIPVDLTNVTWSDALRIVGTVSGTFYKPVTSNTIFVAQNTRTKRTDLDEQAVQTFYLTNSTAQNDANEVVVAIRNLLDPSVKIYLVPSQNAIVMRATPDQLLLAEKLINDLDRARPEVVVDVAILEVNRDKIRNLGITLPQSFGLTPQASPNAPVPTSTTTTGGTSTTPSNFTLNSLAHLNATNFAVNITGGTLNALLSDTNTHILQNPRIRATDGQRATLKIGTKVPIATGSYNAGVSTGVASIGVQTQFTYVDVGVNIDMTPTVHYDHEVTLKMKIEVSSEEAPVTISGVQEPVFGQRTTEQTIQLQEGEPSILAGIITKQNNDVASGTPGLGELPFFKYFFATQNKEVQTDEIVFLLIPHIVRESVLSRMNTRAIDTGTGSSIELRRESEADIALRDAVAAPGPARPKPIGQPTTAANAAAAMVHQLNQQAQPITPPTVPPIGADIPAQNQAQNPPTGPGAPITINVVPAESNQNVGSTFQVSVTLANGRDVFAVPVQLQFNPAVLELVNVDAGDFLGRDGQAVALAHRVDNGLVSISSERPPKTAGVSGQGGLCTLTFKAIAPGDSSLSLVKVGARNSAQENLPAVGSQAVVHVK